MREREMLRALSPRGTRTRGITRRSPLLGWDAKWLNLPLNLLFIFSARASSLGTVNFLAISDSARSPAGLPRRRKKKKEKEKKNKTGSCSFRAFTSMRRQRRCDATRDSAFRNNGPRYYARARVHGYATTLQRGRERERERESENEQERHVAEEHRQQCSYGYYVNDDARQQSREERERGKAGGKSARILLAFVVERFPRTRDAPSIAEEISLVDKCRRIQRGGGGRVIRYLRYIFAYNGGKVRAHAHADEFIPRRSRSRDLDFDLE